MKGKESTNSISVLLSVYNSEVTLNRCLDSLKNQTFQDFNIVCINDASTDSSSIVLEKWQSHFGKRMNILFNEINLGLTKSLNKGLGVIKTEFTARLDADDWWDNTKLEKQMSFLAGSDYNIIGCNYVNVNHYNNRKSYVRLKENNEEIKKNLINRNQFAHSCVVFSTVFIKKIGGYDNSIRFAQDYELWLRALPEAKFYNLQEYLCYRTIGVGISAKKQREQMKQVIGIKTAYIKKYHLSILSYLSIIEIMLMMIMPNFMKKIIAKI
jgi:glycosyltransferase involved in cell wall biosynthesis